MRFASVAMVWIAPPSGVGKKKAALPLPEGLLLKKMCPDKPYFLRRRAVSPANASRLSVAVVGSGTRLKFWGA